MIPASADIAIYAGAVVSVRFSFESAPASDYVIRVYDAHSIVSTQTITPTVDGDDLIAEFDADNIILSRCGFKAEANRYNRVRINRYVCAGWYHNARMYIVQSSVDRT